MGVARHSAMGGLPVGRYSTWENGKNQSFGLRLCMTACIIFNKYAVKYGQSMEVGGAYFTVLIPGDRSLVKVEVRINADLHSSL